MVFVQGSYDCPTIVATIAQALAETDDFTMWDEDAVDNHNHMGYCLKHVPTGHFVTFVPGWGNIGYNSGSTGRVSYQLGIRVIFSAGYNLESHTYEKTDKTYHGLIPFYAGHSADINRLISPNVFSVSMFIDKYRVVGTIQNTYSGGIGDFFALEFFPQAWVEYDDTEELAAVLYNKRSGDNWTTVSDYTANIQYDPTVVDSGTFYLRPYRFGNWTYASNGNNLAGLNQHEGSFMEREAFRSEANNKVHFKFPMYENDVFAGRKPYAETRSWFKVSITGGLQIGDILNWIDPDGVTVHKFIVAVVTAGAMYYAIPYANPFDYAVSDKY
ncbi:hypothetical protein [Methanorbis furvi]|uniref:Uncharacterized protein n=1 Tax=Methanorbis furvi TaxID=3028299 RepID=A0AAE4MAI4_9EURY|nr:hypothetical protein [Methanocorpusculaceae archaeon Ag1]